MRLHNFSSGLGLCQLREINYKILCICPQRLMDMKVLQNIFKELNQWTKRDIFLMGELDVF